MANRQQRRAQPKTKAPPQGRPFPGTGPGTDFTKEPILSDEKVRELAQLVVDFMLGTKKLVIDLDIVEDGEGYRGVVKIMDTKPKEEDNGTTDGTAHPE